MTASTSTRGTRQQKRAFVASLVGTTIEWFDFFIYATAASLVFSTIFFTDLNSYMGTLASFATLGVAFFARPLGSIVFGHLGDRLGRRTTLTITLSLMGLSTGLIGLLPTYAQIGMWAPLLLTLLRIVQGFAVGGEWGGAVLMSVENAPKSRVRFYGSAPQIASPIALVLSSTVMYFVALLPEEQLLAWGWRIPFLAGFVLVIIGMVIRLGVAESAEFATVKKDGRVKGLPVADVLRRVPGKIAVGIGLQASVNTLFYLVTTFMLTMASDAHGLARSDTLKLLLIAAIVDMIAMPSFAALCDRYSPKKVFAGGAAFTVVFAVPMFMLFDTGNMLIMGAVFILVLVFGHATTYAVVSSMTAELFPTEVRYSGAALCSGFAGALWAGTPPLIAAATVPTDGSGHWWPLAAMLIITGIISLISVALFRPASADTAPESETEPVPAA